MKTKHNPWNTLGWLIVGFIGFIFLCAILEGGPRSVTCTGDTYSQTCVTR